LGLVQGHHIEWRYGRTWNLDQDPIGGGSGKGRWCTRRFCRNGEGKHAIHVSLVDEEAFLVAEKAPIRSVKARVRMTIMGKGMPKLAMESFIVCVIPSIHGV
jgi:hypothetical protein